MKRSLSFVVVAVAIIAGALILANAYTYKYKINETITVTGLGETEFTSDLVVWSGALSLDSQSVESGYKELSRRRDILVQYIESKGISTSEMTISPVDVSMRRESIYNSEGNYVGTKFVGYTLFLPIVIETGEIEKVSAMLSDVSSLISQGVVLTSNNSSYYYTKLDDLKLDLIEQASADARARAENIADNAGGGLGKMMSARMGVFQITGSTSNEEYTAGGSFNTSSIVKKARITMKVEYKVD